MTIDDLKELIERISPRHRARKLKDNIEVCDYLNNLYPGVSLNYQLQAIVHNISPYCAVCHTPVKTFGQETCSTICRETLKSTNGAHDLRIQKSRITCLNKYGVDSASKLAKTHEKRLETSMNKFNGSKISPLSRQKLRDRAEQLTSKGRQTLLDTYGVTNPSQLPDHAKKYAETSISRYGASHHTQSDEFKVKHAASRKLLYESFVDTVVIDSVNEDETKIEIYDNPNKVILFTCVDCNRTESLPSETFKWRVRNTGTPCKQCGGIMHGSLKESELATFIQSLGVTIDRNVRLLDGKEIDIFLPELNIGIEFHGLYWHNDLRVDKNYHLEKLNIAAKTSIRLIQIFEDEWHNKRDIVQSRIASLIGKSATMIYARKCIIKEISSDEEREFLLKNHIQGYARSSIKIGLYFDNVLVSLMTFSKPNLSKGHKKTPGTWELLRFCSVINTNVVGAANKLFRHFIEHYEPTKVITFADRRWSLGNVYEKMNFTLIHNTRPNYWYIPPNKVERIHRFALRKNTNDLVNKTEYENRLAQGYFRIWDCGSSKWEWTDTTDKNIQKKINNV